jgi:hypothetical protein
MVCSIIMESPQISKLLVWLRNGSYMTLCILHMSI